MFRAYTILISITFALSAIDLTLEELKPGQAALITSDSHDTWPSWSPDDRRLAIISPISGEDSLYVIDLAKMSVRQSPKKKDVYYAAILETAPKEHYVQVVSIKDWVIDSPRWSPNPDIIAFRKYTCKGPGGCRDFTLEIVSLKDKKTQKLMSAKIGAYAWLSSDEIIFVEEKGKDIKKLNIKSAATNTIYKGPSEISAITTFGSSIVISSGKNLQILDKTGKETEAVPIPAFQGTMSYADGRLYATFSDKGGPAAGVYDVKKKTTQFFISSYDYQPALANNKKKVAFLSEGANGLFIYILP